LQCRLLAVAPRGELGRLSSYHLRMYEAIVVQLMQQWSFERRIPKIPAVCSVALR
jgi:hypothetical protein